ncbi:hypothetical protein [Saccharibacillus endophyticus]|uniref:Uncharacterized protein n=1 Tax=Saccharibacillus endophyticus TaxID=2060666 RepID=A0ABQ1ZM23_9BACL|nr:hypothetical protein [Saccharibacillus endophyticus]GGH68095.1 hypothetical protein GCM10007362_01760 [Saccharibacillus endophyticus]
MTFTINYSKLKDEYKDFSPYFETHRQSLNLLFETLLNQQDSNAINSYLSQAPNQNIMNEIKQKLVYSSTLCFFRAFDLFLAYITLEDKKFKTWSEVTGYYSKFYIIKAINSLLLRGYEVIDYDKRGQLVDSRRDGSFYFAFDNNGFNLYNSTKIEYQQLQKDPQTNQRYGSHQLWWRLLETITDIKGIEKFSRLNYLLDQNWTNPKLRNQINYSLEYLEGFQELDWFDANLKGHHSWNSKDNRDFTSMKNFFKNTDPEDIDMGDYYTDLRVYLWESIMSYLEIYKDVLGTNRIFRIENINYLMQAHETDKAVPEASKNMKKMINELFGIEIEEDPFS